MTCEKKREKKLDADKVRQYREAREKQHRMKAAADRQEQELLAELGDADFGVVDGELAVKREEKRRPSGPPRVSLVFPWCAKNRRGK